MQQGPHIKSELHKLCNIGAHPRVIIFSWLLLRNEILTVDNLKKKGWQLARIFRQENKSPLVIVREILLEYRNWFKR
jgi:hypothetical protein